MELLNVVKEFYEAKSSSDSFKKVADVKKEEAKTIMEGMNITEFKEAGYIAKIGTQNRMAMNETKLLEKLHELGLTECINTVETPNEKKIEDLIYEGKLDPKVLEECMENKVIKTFTVKFKGGK